MKNIKAVVFDAYGTLFDVHTVAKRCEHEFPGYGIRISEIWRQKQLEYTWLRSLMGKYEDFWKVTDDSLAFTLKSLNLEASEELRASILNEYLKLNPYPEVPNGLQEMKDKDLAILSNGTPQMLNDMVENAGLTEAFSSIISVDELKIFKPFMGIYQLYTAKSGIDKEETLFVSSNAWDAAAAKVFGFRVCWINRFDKPFEELGVQPDLIVSNLEELVNKIAAKV
jgi:2-haloacid dehalogenase